jgi:iron complex transport system ATP-binding protein
MSMPMLVFSGVEFGYEHSLPAVLKDLSLSIMPGTVTAILGPNGAGKTTLLHLALGWLKPWQGSILLEGEALQHIPRREFGQKVALIPQREAIPFAYTVFEYVLLGRTPHLPPLGMPGEIDTRIVMEALRRTGVEHLYDHSILAISGGELQLALAARALAQEPRMLLLDEPTSHLDLSNKARLARLLRQLRGQDVAILLTTHEPEVALAVADQVVLMQKGGVYRTGSVQEVITSDALSEVYGIPVKVQKHEGRLQVQWDI